MKTFLIAFLFISFALISCSKKNNEVDLSKNKNPNTTNTTNSFTSFYPVKNIDQNIQKNESVNFSWTENGQEKKLFDYKGKVILLNFWATWCGPCKHEIPDLSQLSKDLNGKDFKLIGISVDENPSALDNYLKSNSLSYTVVNDPSSNLYFKYMSATGGTENVIPQTYLIDKNGKVVETLIGTRSKEDFLKLINKYL